MMVLVWGMINAVMGQLTAVMNGQVYMSQVFGVGEGNRQGGGGDGDGWKGSYMWGWCLFGV